MACWSALLPESPDLGAALFAAYADPSRRYHDVGHLWAVLDAVDLLAQESNDARLVRLAAWFHDAVYDARSHGSEERSAAWAETALRSAGLPEAEVGEVTRLVRLTASHQVETGDDNGSVLVDADLAILASPSAAYAAYTAAVREEYAWVSDSAFRTGRAAILRQLLAMPSLYRTSYGRDHWEADARNNLTEELARLQ